MSTPPGKPLIMLFDEADCLAEQTLITFLRQLRDGFINRDQAPFPTSIALVGMRNIRDYKAKIRSDGDTLGSASPFNVITQSLSAILAGKQRCLGGTLPVPGSSPASDRLLNRSSPRKFVTRSFSQPVGRPDCRGGGVLGFRIWDLLNTSAPNGTKHSAEDQRPPSDPASRGAGIIPAEWPFGGRWLVVRSHLGEDAKYAQND